VLFEQAYEWEFNRPDGSACKLIPGPILSGDKLVDNPEFKADLFRRFPHAKGGEMEGVGFCAAANSLQKPWVLIKAICDWADGKKSDNYQPLAAAAAASLVHHVLLQKTILNSFR
jgi:nucleoside phosphorylase